MNPLKFLPLVLSLSLCACQTAPQQRDYTRQIHDVSLSQKSYDGFQQTFEATVTPMNREITRLVLGKKGEVLGWTPQRLEKEVNEAQEKMLTHSLFFLRFYAPNSDYNDLHKPNSIWKIYLILGNQRFEGEVKKDFSKLAQLQSLYPYFDRFSTGYEITFPVGQSALENQHYEILLTSSLGQAQFQF
jgi:hypothetical protein